MNTQWRPPFGVRCNNCYAALLPEREMVDLTRLRAHPDNKTKQAMQRDCEQAADELEALRKDAERYRWLREHGDNRCTEKDGYGGQTLKMGDCLDSAVDAAMSAAPAVGAA